MKKIVATIATGIIFAGAGMTTVSAEEYQVETGDSLWNIANEYNTTVDDLVDINGLNTTVIQPKQTLFINETYKVKKGDTLIGIGNKFDVKTDDIKQWNNLDSSLIVIGQELEIQGVNIERQDNQPSEAVETNAPEKEAAKTAEKPEPEKETAKVEKSTSEQTKEEPTNEETTKESNPEGKTIAVSSTAYTADCAGCSGVTSTGIDLNANPDAKVIAVDPDVIPLGTKVHVEGYGNAVAGDVGGAINGNEIDIHVGSKGEAMAWGVRTVNVTILD